MKPLRSVRSRVIIVSAMTFLSILPSFGSDALVERKGLTPVGQIIDVSGKAFVKLIPEENFRTALVRQTLVSNDVIKTAGGARLAILFLDATQLKLSSNTTLIIKEVSQSKEKPGTLKILLKLESGEVWTRSKGVTDGLMIETPYATATIRGTEWVISVKDDQSTVAVMEGNVQFANPSGSVNVGRNEQAVVSRKSAPVKSILIRPRDRTQWTYYLPQGKLLGYLKFRGKVLNEPERLFNEGKLNESRSAFEAILSGGPKNPEALTGLGMIELKEGNQDNARRYFEEALDVARSPLALVALSYLAVSRNETEEANALLRQARKFFPEDPLPYIFLSFLYTSSGNFPEAIRECEEGLSATRNDPSILAFQADLYFILDQPLKAKRSVDKLLQENPDSSEGYERLGLYKRMASGNSRRAKEAFRKAILLDPLNDEAMAKLADLLREEGYIPESRRLITKALSLAPWNAMYHYNYGRILADINKIEEARSEFQASLRLDPTFSRAYLGEGIILLKEGQPTEALRELSKASLFEPDLSEIHNFLAIAYYQRGDATSALDELKRAEECDRLDSTPHQLASAIENDLYRPVAAIEEARKVLDLLPYRKASGEALLEVGQNGVMSVNKGLDMLRLPEWSLYYAQKALFFNPYRNTSYIGAGLAYDQLGRISSLQGFNEFANATASEFLMGLVLNVNSLNFSNRYSTLISRPGHYFTLGGDYAFGDSTGIEADLKLSGDFGPRFPLTYFLSSTAYKDSGYLEHGGYKTGTANLILGYKPSYDQDLYVDLSYIGQRGDITPAASSSLTAFDRDQEFKDALGWVQLGYHLRLTPVSHVVAAVRYVNSEGKVENPDFPTDHSGFSGNQNKTRNFAAGIRHLLTFWENHQVSHGMDYNFLDVTLNEDWPYAYPVAALLLGNSVERRTFVYHVYDRWALAPRVTLDGGLFFSAYTTTIKLRTRGTSLGPSESTIDRDTLTLNPRVGVAVDILKNMTIRAAYQRRSTPRFDGELAPVDTVGLIPPTFDVTFSHADDIEGSVEYEFTKDTFLHGLFGYQKLSDISTLGDNKKARLVYGRAAVNRIFGQYFSFSIRYHYNDSRYLDGSGRSLPGVPRDSGDARLFFIHPNGIQLGVVESYSGKMFLDDANKLQQDGYFKTDLYAQKEFFQKHLFLSAAVQNVFDKQYLTFANPVIPYGGMALPARGRTFFLRGEYRF